MTLENKLNLLNLLQKVQIDCQKDYVKISCLEYDYDSKQLYVTISDYNKKEPEITYYIDDIYNNGSNNEIIDMEQLKILQDVVAELLKGE